SSPHRSPPPRHLPSFPTRRSSDLILQGGFDEPPDEAARHTRTGQQERPSGHAEQVVRAGCHGDVASQAAVAPCVRERSRQEPSQDRKSTRLNSSHRTISYAVFCLK